MLQNLSLISLPPVLLELVEYGQISRDLCFQSKSRDFRSSFQKPITHCRIYVLISSFTIRFVTLYIVQPLTFYFVLVLKNFIYLTFSHLDFCIICLALTLFSLYHLIRKITLIFNFKNNVLFFNLFIFLMADVCN